MADEIKLHVNWKDSGPVNDFFMDPPIMKPKILDAWTAARVNQPERAYEKFFLCKPTLNPFPIGVFNDPTDNRLTNFDSEKDTVFLPT